MGILQSKDWRAVEGTDFAGDNRKLVVTGEVEMSSQQFMPALTEANPQGLNPRILLLDLGEVDNGIGAAVTHWEAVLFEKAISHRQYDQLTIVGHTTVDVEELIS